MANFFMKGLLIIGVRMSDMCHIGLGEKVCLYDVIDIVLQQISQLRHDYR